MVIFGMTLLLITGSILHKLTLKATFAQFLQEQPTGEIGTASNNSAGASVGLISVVISKINPLRLPLQQTFVIPTTFVSSVDPWNISTMPSPISTNRLSGMRPRLLEAIAIPYYKNASEFSWSISTKLMSSMNSTPIMIKSAPVHPLFDAVPNFTCSKTTF